MEIVSISSPLDSKPIPKILITSVKWTPVYFESIGLMTGNQRCISAILSRLQGGECEVSEEVNLKGRSESLNSEHDSAGFRAQRTKETLGRLFYLQ
ncbi:hypothetical protein PNOK_0011800 [Pyrrhoderma noxium]|uniref:Uncharacterized protein n=1 Tax=Pyrrhoderma noxium TaxID=2282107 RepID=A0A286UTZ4_9AGAM|nr:hypothetical protein PNOK_0011800 [Pyrrhoderma noxium]